MKHTRWTITILLAAANRDPSVYPDPDRFDIEREDVHHQSFGGGAHLCLGAHLARVEAQEAMGALVASTINSSFSRLTRNRSVIGCIIEPTTIALV